MHNLFTRGIAVALFSIALTGCSSNPDLPPKEVPQASPDTPKPTKAAPSVTPSATPEPTVEPTPAPVPVPSDERVVSTSDFSMNVKKDWFDQTEMAQQTFAQAQLSFTSSTGFNVNVVKTPASSLENLAVTDPKFKELLKADLQILNPISLEFPGFSELDGETAIIDTITLQVGERKVYEMQIGAIKEGNIYILTAATTSAEEAEALAKNTAKTWKWDKEIT